MNKPRLLNLLRALREHPVDAAFNMAYAECCAMGVFAQRHDLQRSFGMRGGDLVSLLAPPNVSAWNLTASYFGISADDERRLFDGRNGCGYAETACAAADYVERFIAAHEQEHEDELESA